AANYTVGFPFIPTSVAVGDFNSDGYLDFAVAKSGFEDPPPDGSVLILLSKGNGTFRTGGNHAFYSPISVAVGGLNADRRLDLAVGNAETSRNNNDGSITVLVGKGDGTFQAARSYAAGHVNFLVVGDFNSDGAPDLAVADGDRGTVSILLGNGDGSFAAAG